MRTVTATTADAEVRPPQTGGRASATNDEEERPPQIGGVSSVDGGAYVRDELFFIASSKIN